MKKLIMLVTILLSIVGCKDTPRVPITPILFGSLNNTNLYLDDKAQTVSLTYVSQMEKAGISTVTEYKNDVVINTISLREARDDGSGDYIPPSYKGEWYTVNIYDTYAEVIVDENTSKESRAIYVNIDTRPIYISDMKVTQSPGVQ